VLVLFVSTVGDRSQALAAPEVSLDPAPDGTLTVVGNGWRPGQHLVVNLGRASFPALADSTGSFEVSTGLVSYQGPLAVHRPASSSLASARLGPAEDPVVPNPLAVLFAQSLVSGIGLAGVLGGVVGLAMAVARSIRSRHQTP